MEFDRDDVRERLCMMDTRLESAFIEPVQEPRQQTTSGNPDHAMHNKAHVGGVAPESEDNEDEALDRKKTKRRYKQETLQQAHMTLKETTPTAKQPIPAFTASSKGILRTWLLDLASRAKCPVQVGKDCLAVSHEEIKESQKLIKEELKFLRSVCGSSVGLPMQATEVCLLHEQHIANLWKNIYAVFSQLLAIYEKERSSFLLRNDPYSCEAVQRELKLKSLALDEEMVERDKVEIELRQTKQELKELHEQLANPEAKTMRRRIHPNASGVHLKLKQIHEDLLKLPGKLEISSSAKRATARSIVFKSKPEEKSPKEDQQVKQKGGRVVPEEIRKVVSILEVMSSRDVDAFMKNIDPTIKAVLLKSMMQNVLERKDNSIIADIMNSTHSLDDKLLLVKKFVDQFSQEQQLTLLSTVLDTTSMSDADKSEAAFKFVDCMSRPFAESFVRELAEKYQVEGRARKFAIGQIKRNSLISTIPVSPHGNGQPASQDSAKNDNSLQNIMSRCTQTGSELECARVTAATQTHKSYKSSRKSSNSSAEDPNQDESDNEGSDEEEGAQKTSNKKSKKRHKQSRAEQAPKFRIVTMWEKGSPPWEKYMRPPRKKMRYVWLLFTLLRMKANSV